MPSKAISPALHGMTELQNNDTWTDGLPKCKLSGVGVSANQTYRTDGTPFPEHECEDRSINFCLDKNNSTFLYGVFDGHDGSRAANFASQRMPAELSFEQLEGKNSEEEVKAVFQQAFLSVENSFLESVDPKIAERTQLLEKIPDGMSQFEAAQQYPETISRLQELEEEIRGGTSCAVTLINKDVLYIGNVGDTRVLLCQKDKSGVLKVRQLSIDHTTSSYEELERLSNLSLDIDKIRGTKFGNHEVTRCLGNYFLKGGYSEFDMLRSALAEPVIAHPYVVSLPLDASCRFLLIMSHGLYKSYEEATGSKQSNKEIATMVLEQMIEQATLTSVSQTVVDKIVRLHHDKFLAGKETFTKREDITLIVRNFNFPFPRAFNAHAAFMLPSERPSPLNDINKNPSSEEACSVSNSFNVNFETESIASDQPRHFFASTDPAETTQESSIRSGFHPSGNTTSTESSKLSNPSLTQLTLDENGLIQPYVNFDLYYQAVNEAISNGNIPISQINLYK